MGRLGRFLRERFGSRKLLVVGTGRSGTHWLARILERHRRIRATVEVNPGFRWVTRMAIDPPTRDRLYPRLVLYYRFQHLWSAPKHYLDKSHPNLWIADLLANSFEDVLFLGIQRNPYATVASMLNHRGVKKWHENWRDYPVPNPFLGIGEADAARYDGFSMARKSAMRWKAHDHRMREVEALLGKRILVVDHEALVRETEETVARVQRFIGLERPLRVARADASTLTKWKRQLSPQQIEEIRQVTGVSVEQAEEVSHI